MPPTRISPGSKNALTACTIVANAVARSPMRTARTALKIRSGVLTRAFTAAYAASTTLLPRYAVSAVTSATTCWMVGVLAAAAAGVTVVEADGVPFGIAPGGTSADNGA